MHRGREQTKDGAALHDPEPGEPDERFRVIFNAANDAIFLIDPHKERIINANPKACELLGYSQEELLGMSVTRVHPCEMDLIRDIWQEILSGDVVRTDQLTCTTKAKQVVPAEISFSMAQVKDQCYVLAMVRDIAERTRAQKALRESEARYRSLYTKTPVMLHSADAEDRLLSVSDYWLSRLGYERDEVLGRPATAFLTEASRRYAKMTCRPAFLKNGILDAEPLQFQKKSGEVIDILLSAIAERDAGGEIIRSLAVSVDVTEAKRAEESLRKSEARYRAVVDTQTEMISRSLPDTTLTFVNEAYCKYFGKEADELVGQSFLQFVVQEMHESVRAHLASLVERPRNVVWEHEVLLPDGTRGWNEWIDIPLFDEQGRVTEFQSVGRDVTERKRLEAAILEISESEQRRLGQDLHDDLGQTLNGVWFMSERLKDKLEARQAPEAEGAKQISHLLERALSQIRMLIKGLNAVDQGPEDLIPALKEFSASILQIYSDQVMSCSVITEETLLIPDNQTATYLYRIAQEAVMNAIKHGEATRIKIQLQQRNGLLELNIRDNGSGIEVLSRRGDGLGLKIMAYRAHSIHGSLNVSRLNEGGTLVTCRVPHRH